jgi:putative phosphoesterase
MRIGVLSDTHLPHRLPQLPASVVETFASAAVDLILHAGDVDDPRALKPLSQVAPVIAVRGNVHLQDLSQGGASLPYHVELTLCGRRMIVTHGHRHGVIGILSYVAVAVAYQLGLLTRERINRGIARRLYRRFPWADVVVFGHTHQPFQTWIDRTFFFNPGAVSQDEGDMPSVGILTLGHDVLETELVPLPDSLPQRNIEGQLC